MLKKNIIIKSSAMFLLIISALAFISQSNAKKIADNILKPAGDDLLFKGCSLSPLFYKDREFVGRLTGFGWKVAYNTDKYLIIQDVAVFVSFLGSVEMTNPTQLEQTIQQRYNE